MEQLTQPVPSKRSVRSSPSISFRRFAAIVLVLLGLQALLFVAQVPKYLPVTGDNIYPESAGVLSAYQWARGVPIYQDYRQSPYLSAAFPPLWYMTIGLGAKVGLLLSLNSLVVYGRLLSLASLLGIGLVAYRWNRKQHFPPRLSIFASVFFLSFPILIPWAVTARPDFPALFLSLIAVYCIGTRSGEKGVLLASVIAALSFLMRHNSVSAPVAIVLWLLWQRKWRQAASFCFYWGILVGVTFTYFQQSTHGMFLLNIGGSKFGAMALTYIRDILINLTTPPGYVFSVVLFAFGAFACIEAVRQSDDQTKLMVFYAVVSAFFAILGSAAAGAAANHFLELSAVASVLAPFGLARLERSWEQSSSASLLILVLLIAVLLPAIDIHRSNMTHDRPEDFRAVAALTSNKHVFSDIPYVAARANPPELIDLASLTNTELSGGKAAWSSLSVIEDLQANKYDLAVLSVPVSESILPNPNSRYPRYPRIDAGIQKAIHQYYPYCFRLNKAYVYAPTAPADLSLQACSVPMQQLP
jgi:hypothetical protein